MEKAVTEATAGCDECVNQGFSSREKVICGDGNVFEVKPARPGDELYMIFEDEAAGVELSVVRLQ